MATLRIYDLEDRWVLTVDLARLLVLLVPRSLQAEWTVNPVRSDSQDLFEASGAGGEELEALAAKHAVVSGAGLSTLAMNSPQIVWGEFVARLPGETSSWLTLRAIDSTFYQVETEDDAVLAKIRSTYNDVRDAGSARV